MEKEQLFAVIWEESSREFYGIGDEILVTVEPKEEIRMNVSKHKQGRPSWRYTEPLAIFTTKEEAEAFRDGNTDWEVVSCNITPNPTKHE